MREDVSTDLTRSARDFLRWVWPVIAPSLGGGDIYPVEFTERGAGPHRNLFQAFDFAGIDAWHYHTASGRLRGLSSRVQWCPRAVPFDTFSIRWSRPGGQATEISKQLAALDDGRWGAAGPALTIQAYLDGDNRRASCRPATRVLSVGLIRTADLYRYIQLYGLDDVNEITNGDASSTFKPVAWSRLRASGVQMKIFQGDASAAVRA